MSVLECWTENRAPDLVYSGKVMIGRSVLIVVSLLRTSPLNEMAEICNLIFESGGNVVPDFKRYAI